LKQALKYLYSDTHNSTSHSQEVETTQVSVDSDLNIQCSYTLNERSQDWGCSSVVERLPSTQKAGREGRREGGRNNGSHIIWFHWYQISRGEKPIETVVTSRSWEGGNREWLHIYFGGDETVLELNWDDSYTILQIH
jgi:hypothetical protein